MPKQGCHNHRGTTRERRSLSRRKKREDKFREAFEKLTKVFYRDGRRNPLTWEFIRSCFYSGLSLMWRAIKALVQKGYLREVRTQTYRWVKPFPPFSEIQG